MHIDINFLVVKERVQSRQLSIEHIGLKTLVADPFTKGISPKKFYEHIPRIGVIALDDV